MTIEPTPKNLQIRIQFIDFSKWIHNLKFKNQNDLRFLSIVFYHNIKYYFYFHQTTLLQCFVFLRQ